MGHSEELIKTIIENWDQIEKISSIAWQKVKVLFERGEKSIGFIKRKSIFSNYYTVSQQSFMKKYSKYIIPTEYRGYLLESIVISDLYKNHKVKDADRKRLELGKVNPKALRIYNLYNSGILSSLFERIEHFQKEGKNEEEIRGIISKELDDLINDRSIIYVNLYHDEEELFYKVKRQLNANRYCLVYGSGDNARKIKYLFDKIIEDSELDNFEVKHNKKTIGDIAHFNLVIFEKISVEDDS